MRPLTPPSPAHAIRSTLRIAWTACPNSKPEPLLETPWSRLAEIERRPWIAAANAARSADPPDSSGAAAFRAINRMLGRESPFSELSPMAAGCWNAAAAAARLAAGITP